MNSDSNVPLLNSRAAVLVTGIVIFIATAAVYTGKSITVLFSVLAMDGMIALGWIVGACALGAVLLRVFKIRSNSLLQISTAGGLGLGVFSLLTLLLGLSGALNRVTAIAMPIISIAAYLIDWFYRHGKTEFDFSGIKQKLFTEAGLSWFWVFPVVSLAIAIVAASVMPGMLWKPLDPHPYDVISYHLQIPREWYEAGRIVPVSHNVFSYFPFMVEMQFLALMHAAGGPWGRCIRVSLWWWDIRF